MAPIDPAGLPRLPEARACPCGGAVRWNHTAYLGHGESAGVYTCQRCGLAYHGPLRVRSDPGRGRRHQQTPAVALGGPPANPVLDPATAERLLARLRQEAGAGGQPEPGGGADPSSPRSPSGRS